MLTSLYALATCGVVCWVFRDAGRRRQRHPWIIALGVCVLGPVGILVYLGTRD